MKTRLFFLITFLISFTACQKDIESPNMDSILSDKLIHAEIEQSVFSKTYIDEFRNVRFQKADQIVLFNGSTLGKKYHLQDSDADQTSGNFYEVESENGSIGAGVSTDCIVAYYPYAPLKLESSNQERTSYVLRGVNLPHQQVYDGSHFISQNNLPMVSFRTKTQGDILFKNLSGVLKLNVKGTDVIKQISLKGNNHEKISGEAEVILNKDENPLLSMSSAATEEIVLDCGEGIALSETEARQFMIVLPPTVFEKGFEVTLTDTKGGVMVMNTTGKKTISRSAILKMAEFTYSPSAPNYQVPEDEIWYNGSHIIQLTDPTSACFGANVVSVTTEGGKGIIKFDGKVTKIGDNAFKGYWTLTGIFIPNSVTSIGKYAFDNCRSLTSFKLPENVRFIDDYAFHNCAAISEITIPYSIKHLGQHVFSECSGLKKCVLPESLTSISDYLFERCNSLADITFSKKLTTIGNNSFFSCEALTDFIIPDSVTSIGEYAFWGCKKLSDITIPSGIACISRAAFSYCWGFTHMVIPDGVTEIGESAFEYCYGLRKIDIPESVTTIGKAAFAYCENLSDVIIPKNITKILDNTFYYCYKITHLDLPEGLTFIGANAFSVSGITSLSIPSGITSLSFGLFSGCEDLVSVKIPETITEIDHCVFFNCPALKEFKIPNMVTSLGDSVFDGCSSLTSMTIPAKVTKLGSELFINCPGISAVYMKPLEPPTITSTTFKGIRTILVPDSSLNTYQNHYLWKNLSDKIAGYTENNK